MKGARRHGGRAPAAIAVRAVSLDTALRNAAFTFPDLRRTVLSRRLREPLLGAAALVDGKAVAAAVAELQPAGAAEILSLYVRPEFRRRGLADGLLQALETTLARQGVHELGGAFRTHWSERAAIEALLRRRDWSEPAPRRILVQVDERMLAADWLVHQELPPGWSLFPWGELAAEDREGILRRQRDEAWFPEALTPFQLEDRIHAPTSLGLRHDGRVAGWLITHLVSPETLQYTTLFVEREAQRTARAIPLLVASVLRQRDAGIPRSIFMIDVENTPMMRFYERRLKPLAAQTAEIRWSRKELSPGAAAPS
jgi:GNAT superfamily N-acetyltransferase